MAKKYKGNLITASFHYLVKVTRNEKDPANPTEHPFTDAEFERVIESISVTQSLDVSNPDTISRIKMGNDIPFGDYKALDFGMHFGSFEGAYYGQKYRNNMLGDIDPESLNLRKFFYLIHRDRKGRIVIGVTYHGQFGDYDGLSNFLIKRTGRNGRIISRSITSIAHELGSGLASEITLSYRKAKTKAEGENIFGKSGAITIKRADFGEGFDGAVSALDAAAKGSVQDRKHAIGDLVRNGDILEIDDEDIIGCTALIREGRQTRTIYFIGENNFATKFSLNLQVEKDGSVNAEKVQEKLTELYLNKVLGMIRKK